MRSFLYLILRVPFSQLRCFLLAMEVPLFLRRENLVLSPMDLFKEVMLGLTSQKCREITDAADRIYAMSDNAGQTALRYAVRDKRIFKNCKDGCDRALRLFLSDPSNFRRAEELRFIDENREGRQWCFFTCRRNSEFFYSSSSEESFKSAFYKRFASRHAYIAIWNQKYSAEESENRAAIRRVEVFAFWEEETDSSLRFNEKGELINSTFGSIATAELMYWPSLGRIGVVTVGGVTSEEIAWLFILHFLGEEVEKKHLTTHSCDLDALLFPKSFPTDAEDGVGHVDVVRLELMPIDSHAEQIVLKCGGMPRYTIWDMMTERLSSDFFPDGWVVLQAKLLLRFYPKAGERYGRVLPVTLSRPCRCDLWDRMREERRIGEKYLNRWGINIGGSPICE